MAGGAGGRRGIIAGINVTPLVDVVLVLLIVFMLTAELIARQAIEVALPRAATATAATPATLAVTLTREGRVRLDGRDVSAERLREAVRAAVARDRSTQALIAADRDVAHGRVVWALDLVRSLGVTSFAIQVDPAAAAPPGAPGDEPRGAPGDQTRGAPGDQPQR